jgi:hypothetical protein
VCELAGNEKKQRLAAPDEQIKEQFHVAGPRLGGHTYGLAPGQAVGYNLWGMGDPRIQRQYSEDDRQIQ